MIQRRMILLLGCSATGKTTAGRVLADRGWRHIEASDVFRRLAGRRSGAATKETGTTDQFFATAGFDAVARAVMDSLEDGLPDPVVLSGLRTPEEVLYLLRSQLSPLVIVLHTRFRTRLERTGGNSRSLRKRDAKEAAWGLMPIVDDLADRIILNERSLAEFAAEIEGVADHPLLSTAKAPSEMAQHRLAALSALESPDPVPASDLTALALKEGLLQRGADKRWEPSPRGRTYIELMNARWHSALVPA